MNRTQDEWIKVYTELGALWMHNGKPSAPHAELASGAHSAGFFNSGLIMERPKLVCEAAEDLRELLHRNFDSDESVGRVVGPAMGAITLAHEVAKVCEEYGGGLCCTSFAEKVMGKAENGDDKVVGMQFNRAGVRSKENVLLLEDVLTTGDSLELVAHAVSKAGGNVLPFILALVNRSGQEKLGGRRVVSLINKHLPTWLVQKGEQCALCKGGSVALRPKQADNWRRLVEGV